jgi:flagellar motility protein MotE (MotC chaperone)
MSRIRLIPLVLIAISSLFTLKLAGLVVNGNFMLGGVSIAQAQSPEAGAAKPAAEASEGEGAASAAGGEAGAEETAGAGTGLVQMPKVAGNRPPSSREAVLERLAERRGELEARERELDLRENLIKAAEQRVEARLAILKQVQARIEGMVKQREAEQQAQISGLITMYESMKPKSAAAIFDRLDIEVLVDVVEQMDPRKMAEILAKMSPAAAEKLTLEIARRGREEVFPSEAENTSGLPKIEADPAG